ncbi:MAG: NAD(P)/FAD-dependent oxidoreductase [Candidatus Eremiobacteraeota bacterium]|nr:NAD(P)/FAD-dependent oxidoreductase [Candidatus Eremiobacteraeota bacterium]
MAHPQPHWAIIGGGLLGMTLAHRLRSSGREVSLFEAAPQLGGLASPWRIGDFTWDRHYHVTLLSDLALRALLGELNLEADIQWVKTRTGLYHGGRLYSISNLREFLAFPGLDMVAKARLALTIFYAAHYKQWSRLEDISVSDWLVRLSGKSTFERFWLPLLRAKLGEGYRQASAAFIWAIIARLYAARRTGLKEEMFGYVPGGYARVLKRFAARLAGSGVAVQCSRPAERVEREADGGMRVRFKDGTTAVYDNVVVTAPGPLAARLCPQLNQDESARLRDVAYQGIICASLVLKKPLAGFYVTNITDAGTPFTGIIEMSALVSKEQFGGKTLVYLPKYAAPDDPAFALSDAEIERRFVPALLRMFPHLSLDDIVCFKVSRVPYVLPVATLGYSKRVAPMVTSIPGLFTVNAAHILNGTLNVNETVQLANRAIGSLLDAEQALTAPLAVAG